MRFFAYSDIKKNKAQLLIATFERFSLLRRHLFDYSGISQRVGKTLYQLCFAIIIQNYLNAIKYRIVQ